MIYLAAWGRRPSTLIHYGDEMRRFGVWARSMGLTPYSISRVHIDDYVVHIRTERNLGGRSIAARLTAIRQFFKWMNAREFRIDDQTKAIQNPKFRKPLPQPLSQDELAVLLDLPLRGGDGPIARRDAAMLRTFAWAGLRVSEAAALDWDHLDLTPGRATVSVVDGKGGKDRVVPIAEPLCDALLHYLELRIDVDDFSVVCLRATSHGQALYVEERLIVGLDPRWNRPEWAGFGSKHQGKLRAGGQGRHRGINGTPAGPGHVRRESGHL